ncbi:hypothetical protein GCM10027162_45260 [Streptomyces incanus]
MVGGGLSAGRRPWLFSGGPLDASASERDIEPVPGVRKAVAAPEAGGHVTVGGCLEEVAKGWVAGVMWAGAPQ